MKISFHSCANKTNFHMKRFALSLGFIMRFTATRKWPIVWTLTSHEIEYRDSSNYASVIQVLEKT